MNPVRLLALAASARPQSLNRQLLAEAVASAQAAGAEVTVLDYKQCSAPAYCSDSQLPLPAGARLLSEALRAHDGLMLATPEYNWSMPGSLKNLIDWLSLDKPQAFAGRTGLLLCATPSNRGGISGLQQLRVPLEALGMWVHPKLTGIGGLQEGDIKSQINSKDAEHLQRTVTDFVRSSQKLRMNTETTHHAS